MTEREGMSSLEVQLDEAAEEVVRFLGDYAHRQARLEGIESGTVVDLEAHVYVSTIRSELSAQGQDFFEVRRQRGMDNAKRTQV